MNTLKTENKTLKEDIINLKNELNKTTEVENKIQKINNCLDYRQDYSLRNNLHFDDLDEKAHESWEETQELNQRELRDKLYPLKTQLKRAPRVGPSGSAGLRTTVARFRDFAD